MSDALTIPISGLRQGPVTRTWHLGTPEEALGEIPGGIRGIDVTVEVRREGRSGVRARGRLTADARLACRRCLADVDVRIETPLDAWYRDPELVTPGEDGVWALDPAAGEIDLSTAIREELWLAMTDYVVCEDGCEGLCPGCGARLAEEECRCAPPAPDPRWGALEALREEAEPADGEAGATARKPGGDA